ncbi:hypothetical protein Tco_0190160 [Tanacetum coccineum]
MQTERGDGVVDFKRRRQDFQSDGVMDLATASAFDEELEAPIEDQPLPMDALPTALSPGYIADFDPEEDDEDPEEDPADHPVDGGDNDDNESSDDE